MSSSTSIAEVVTVIVTTSPSRSDPEPGMLLSTLASLELAGLSDCRILLVADKFSVGVPRKGGRRCGRLPADRIEAYEERNDAVMLWAKKHLERMEILVLDSWHGFALAVKRALGRVATPLVAVVQHDLEWRRPVDLTPIAETLLSEQDHEVSYIYFRRDGQKNYREKCKGLHRIDVGASKYFGESKVPLMRLARFFDGTHIAKTDWYVDLLSSYSFKKGQFIDTHLGFDMLKQAILSPELIASDCGSVSKGVLAVGEKYKGLWMWDGDNGQPIIRHLNGRAMMSASELERAKAKRAEKPNGDVATDAAAAAGATTCKHWLNRGTCKFGDACRNLHNETKVLTIPSLHAQCVFFFVYDYYLCFVNYFSHSFVF